MKPLIVAALLTLTLGCATLRTLNDARKDLCDLLGEEQRSAIQAEADRAGIPFTEALNIFKATCLIRLATSSSELKSESIGAIGAKQ